MSHVLSISQMTRGPSALLLAVEGYNAELKVDDYRNIARLLLHHRADPEQSQWHSR
jgi:hypothetical protein